MNNIDFLFFLKEIGLEGRFVGGCVRDFLLARPFNDYDVATPYEPSVVLEALDGRGIKAIPTGISHGTVTVPWKGNLFQVTSLRKDVETDGRHARVIFGESWKEDAKRRDFTLNALYYDQEKEVHDYVGGLSDLKKKNIRFIGDPDQRIREDYLRLWRYYRFLTAYGDPGQAIDLPLFSYQTGLHNLSKERVQSELFKILFNPKACEGLTAAQALLELQFCVSPNLQKFREINNQGSLLLKLYCLFQKDLVFFQENIRLTRAQLRYFKDLLSALQELSPIYVFEKWGADIWKDWMIEKRQNDFHHPPKFPLSGKDLKGIIQDFKIQQTIDQVLRWWSLCQGEPSQKECLEKALCLNSRDANQSE